MSVQTCVSYWETDPVSTICVTAVWILELWLNICITDLTPESNQAILQSKWTFVLGALLIYHNPGRTWPWTLTTKLWLVYPLVPLKVCVKFEDLSWWCSWDSVFRRMGSPTTTEPNFTQPLRLGFTPQEFLPHQRSWQAYGPRTSNNEWENEWIVASYECE